mgnify:CR=1 FL=1
MESALERTDLSTRPSGPGPCETQSRTVPMDLAVALETTLTDLASGVGPEPRLAGHAAVSAALRQGLNRSTWLHRGERRSKNRDRMRRGPDRSPRD